MWADAPLLPMSTPFAESATSAFDVGALGPRLAALGPVLCLYRRELARPEHPPDWLALCAARAQALCELSSEGPREALRFFDVAGRPLLQVCLLSDSDFLGWEQALQAPCVQRDPSPSPLCQLPWLARLRWRARLLRFDSAAVVAHRSSRPTISAAGMCLAVDWCRRYGCSLVED
ncbi:MAG: hypothetical protein MEQ07_03010 [Aquimonas sp.]|nr:hypothetical protein [Aquimonas sp.]